MSKKHEKGTTVTEKKRFAVYLITLETRNNLEYISE